jgi:predicted transglutaminase-like cysteine proteinase
VKHLVIGTANRPQPITLFYWIMSLVLLTTITFQPVAAETESFSTLFGYSEISQPDIADFPQWEAVIKVQKFAPRTKADCQPGDPSEYCAKDEWQGFLAMAADLAAEEQLAAVNDFANRNLYIADIENYGESDYWALPQQFLQNGGDCEDYAIIKYLSLRKLGWSDESLRLVVVQDTQIAQAHAILAVSKGDDIWILDNQEKAIKQDNSIEHYAPVYSLAENQWWLHVQTGQAMAATVTSQPPSPSLP